MTNLSLISRFSARTWSSTRVLMPLKICSSALHMSVLSLTPERRAFRCHESHAKILSSTHALHFLMTTSRQRLLLSPLYLFRMLRRTMFLIHTSIALSRMRKLPQFAPRARFQLRKRTRLTTTSQPMPIHLPSLIMFVVEIACVNILLNSSQPRLPSMMVPWVL